jgi:hypothetical protein
MSTWNWNPKHAKEGPRYEVLTADYCSLYKRVLVHRNFARVDSSHIWRYCDRNAEMVEQGTHKLLAFRDGAPSAEDEAIAVEFYEADKTKGNTDE